VLSEHGEDLVDPDTGRPIQHALRASPCRPLNTAPTTLNKIDERLTTVARRFSSPKHTIPAAVAAGKMVNNQLVRGLAKGFGRLSHDGIAAFDKTGPEYTILKFIVLSGRFAVIVSNALPPAFLSRMATEPQRVCSLQNPITNTHCRSAHRTHICPQHSGLSTKHFYNALRIREV